MNTAINNVHEIIAPIRSLRFIYYMLAASNQNEKLQNNKI